MDGSVEEKEDAKIIVYPFIPSIPNEMDVTCENDNNKMNNESTLYEDEDDSVRIMAMLSDAMDAEADESTWIQWFCALPENEGFVQIEEEYLQDSFNLIGLGKFIPNMNKVLDYILDQENTDSESESSIDSQEDSDEEDLKLNAIILYGLVHARFLMTNQGMHLAFEKYRLKVYGVCPNVACNGQAVMPIGLSDKLNVDNAKIYCPSCCDIYHSNHGSKCWLYGNDHDGSFYGTSFAPMFFLRALGTVISPILQVQPYVPKIFGFRVNPRERNRVIIRHYKRKKTY